MQIGGPRRDDSEGKYFIATTISASESNLGFNYHSYVTIYPSATWNSWRIMHRWQASATKEKGVWNVCEFGPYARYGSQVDHEEL